MRIRECPFCGSSLIWYENDCMVCRECGCDGPLVVDNPNEKTAIEKWNTRTGTSYNGKTAEEWYRMYKDTVAERHQ